MTIKLYLLFRPNHLKRLVYTKDEICVKVSYYYYYYVNEWIFWFDERKILSHLQEQQQKYQLETKCGKEENMIKPFCVSFFYNTRKIVLRNTTITTHINYQQLKQEKKIICKQMPLFWHAPILKKKSKFKAYLEKNAPSQIKEKSIASSQFQRFCPSHQICTTRY